MNLSKTRASGATFPSMMSREGARGQEHMPGVKGIRRAILKPSLLPERSLVRWHFTPGVLDVEIKQGFEGRDVQTTAAKTGLVCGLLPCSDGGPICPKIMTAILPSNFYRM